MKEFLRVFAEYLQGERALEQAFLQNQIERHFSFSDFERSASRCADELAGFGLADVVVEDFPADGVTEWSGWRAMKAWDVRAAKLSITHPVSRVLTDWSTCPESLVMYSSSSVSEGELVEWDGQDGVDLHGKIPLTRDRVIDLAARMRRAGVRGIVSDFIGTLPGVRDRLDLPDAVRWENYAFKNAPGERWGFMLTPRQGDLLRALMRSGSVRLKAEIDSRLYDGRMKSVTAVIPGKEPGSHEVLLTSHLYEPGANDNASGVGLGLEVARSLALAMSDGRIERPTRSIRFLFGWEGFGLMAWAHKHKGETPWPIGGLNIDEIGVDQASGRSVAHLFMPPQANYSCVGSLAQRLCGEVLSPQIRWKAVADRPEIINDAVTCDPNIDIPLATLIQYPSRYYHSSDDRIGTLSTDVLSRVGGLCGAFLYVLASGTPPAMTYLESAAAASVAQSLSAIEVRLINSSWPFSAQRTCCWIVMRIESLLASLRKLGFSAHHGVSLRSYCLRLFSNWWIRWEARFPKEMHREDSRGAERARRIVLCRNTYGMTMPPEIRLPPEAAEAFTSTLYRSNLDLVFMKIAYWANGRRSLMDIIELLEMDLDEILQDTSIARTGSGSLIRTSVCPAIDVRAALDVTDVIVRCGLLSCVPR